MDMFISSRGRDEFDNDDLDLVEACAIEISHAFRTKSVELLMYSDAERRR